MYKQKHIHFKKQNNLFAALDSDEEEPTPRQQPKKTSSKPKAKKSSSNSDSKKTSGKKASSKKQKGGKGGGNWEAPSFDARNDRKKQRKPRNDNKKKTRAPRNGYGKAKAGPKKGGVLQLGIRSGGWKGFCRQRRRRGQQLGDDGEKVQVEEEDNTLTFEEFQKKKLRSERSPIFSPLASTYGRKCGRNRVQEEVRE